MPKDSPCPKPTMRLVSLSACITDEEALGIPALETSPAMFTPESHAEYELESFVDPAPRAVHGMPWEEDDESFLKFRRQLPDVITADVIYDKVALPQLEQPHDASQRTLEWHQARAFAVTASQFNNTSEDALTLLKTKTYPKAHAFHGNIFTEWGTVHEKHAEEAFKEFLATKNFDGELTHPPHIRHASKPFLGFSPDALLWSKNRSEVALVEYKCPAGRRSGKGHPYGKEKFCVPPRYMPQIQGSLHLLRGKYPAVRCVRAWFVVWQPHQFFVTHVPFVPQFASKTVERAEAFFRDRFLPACVDAIHSRELMCGHSNRVPTSPSIVPRTPFFSTSSTTSPATSATSSASESAASRTGASDL